MAKTFLKVSRTREMWERLAKDALGENCSASVSATILALSLSV